MKYFSSATDNKGASEVNELSDLTELTEAFDLNWNDNTENDPLSYIDLEDIDAIYLVKSVLGMMGGDTNHYITIGKLIDGEMHKVQYRTPELTEERSEVVSLDECFTEAIIYYDKEKEN